MLIRLRRHLLAAVLLAPVAAGVLALGLIFSESPHPDPRRDAVHDAMTPPGLGQLPERLAFTARDGARLGYRAWQGDGDTMTIIALHGAGGHSGWMAGLAAMLANAVPALVIAPDLRGHGPDPARRGDVDYIGQYEDDLADLIAHLASAGREVVLLGHSAGGGLVIRFAGGPHRDLIDRAILIAPFLQHDAPTARPLDPEGWARPMKRRIAGLWMLNAVGVEALNHLTVVQFRFPSDLLQGEASHLATRGYTYRLQFGFSPRRDWRRDAASLPPFLLVAGRADTAFDADAYEPSLAPIAPQGRFLVLDDAAHADILGDVRLVSAVADYLRRAD